MHHPQLCFYSIIFISLLKNKRSIYKTFYSFKEIIEIYSSEALVSFEVPRRREAVQRRKPQAILSPSMANPTETDSERCDCPSLFHVLGGCPKKNPQAL